MKTKKRTSRRTMVAFALMGIACFMIMVLLAVIFLDTSRVQAGVTGPTCYESVEIEEGESLWALAEKYRPTGTRTASFAKTIASLNGISVDTRLKKGGFILVPLLR